MNKMNPIHRTVLGALFVALCVVLPIAFHSIPDAGSMLLPMHIPVLVCGLICGWPYGFICGLLGPALSCLLTGMPLMAILPAMMIGCATYGAVTGMILDLYIALIVAMIAGRITAVDIAPEMVKIAGGTLTIAHGMSRAAIDHFLFKFSCVFRYSFWHRKTPHFLVQVYHTCLTNGVQFKRAASFLSKNEICYRLKRNSVIEWRKYDGEKCACAGWQSIRWARKSFLNTHTRSIFL